MWYGLLVFIGISYRLRGAHERRRNDGSSQVASFGTMVRVIDQRSGRSIQVRINDRGPFVRGRIIDLTRAAAQRLGVDGLAKVCIAQI